jgi:hypothetical protein
MKIIYIYIYIVCSLHEATWAWVMVHASELVLRWCMRHAGCMWTWCQIYSYLAPKSIFKRHSIFDSLYDTLITSPYKLHSIYNISFQQIIYLVWLVSG